jgi:hypothetical protein
MRLSVALPCRGPLNPGRGLILGRLVTSRFDPEVVLDAVIAANTVAIELCVLAVLVSEIPGNPELESQSPTLLETHLAVPDMRCRLWAATYSQAVLNPFE